jgi:hypothetical protein
MNQLKIICFVLTVLLLVPLCVFAQQKQEQKQDNLALEIAFSDEKKDKKPFYVAVARADASERLFAIVKSPDDPESPHFKVTSKIEADAVRVEVFALPGNMNEISRVKEIEEMPHEAVASILLRLGETVQISEVTRFGVKPLQIRVVGAKP